MAQIITHIRIPFCVWTDTIPLSGGMRYPVNGTFYVKLWSVTYPNSPSLLATGVLSASLVPRTYLEYGEDSGSWKAHNIDKVNQPTFLLDTPITFDVNIKQMTWEGVGLEYEAEKMLYEAESLGLMVSLFAAGTDLRSYFRFNAWPFPGVSGYAFRRYNFDDDEWKTTLEELGDNTARYFLPELLDEDGVEISSQPLVMIGWNDGTFYDQVNNIHGTELNPLTSGGYPLQNIGYEINVDTTKLPPNKPTNPYPSNNAVDVNTGLTYLQWTPSITGTVADYFNVYFDNGIGEFSSIAYKVFGSELVIGLTLSDFSTYNWRVDAVNVFGTTTGDVWTFTTERVINYVPTITEVMVWGSRSNDYDNFKDGVKDDDSFAVLIPTQNEARWIECLESLIVGTSGDEWIVGSNKLKTGLTPTNVTIKQQSEYGSSKIRPIKINSSILFVDYVGRKIREMTLVDDKYVSPDLTVLAEHITYSGITSMARVKNPESLVLLTLSNGKIICFCYNREQELVAFSEFNLGGDGFAISACSIPQQTEDAIYIIQKRLVNLDYIFSLEKFYSRELTDIKDSFFVDSGVVSVLSTASSTVTGLSHLEGKTVKILADGVVADDAIVVDG